MQPHRHFKRNLVIIGALHVLVVIGIWLFGQWSTPTKPVDVMWLDGGSMGGGESGESAKDSAASAPEAPPAPPEAAPPEPPMPPPNAAPEMVPPPPEPPAASEIVLPKISPEPTPKPHTPKPVTPKPATPKPTPKATPKKTPKPTPKATPKKTPAASPKPKAVSDDGDEDDEAATPKPKASPAKKAASTPGTGKKSGENAEGNSAASGKTGAAKSGGNGVGTGNGKGSGKAGGGSGESQFGWYFSMIHDRFHNRWDQPTSIVRSAQDFVTTLHIKINKDGTIAAREIVNSSGNSVMDDSVLAAAQKVQQIDPLPAGLGSGDAFEINIVFKLDQGQ